MRKSALLICILALFNAGFGQGDPEKLRLFEGRMALNQRNYAEALKIFDELEVQNPFLPYLYAFRGQAHYSLQNTAKALSDFDKAIQLYYRDVGNGDIQLIIFGDVVLGRNEQEALAPYRMYYQRARLRHWLRMRQQALSDLQTSINLNSGFTEAKAYQKLIREGDPPIPLSPMYPLGKVQGPSNPSKSLDKRPKGNPYQPEINEEALLKDRTIYTRAKELKKGRDKRKYNDRFISRGSKENKLFGDGDFTVAYATQDYIKIESIRLTPDKTIVRFRIDNPDENTTYNLRLGSDMYITDRIGNPVIPMKLGTEGPVKDIATEPGTTTELAGGAALNFSVIFEPVKNTMGYISIIEGNRNDGMEWNFYDIDLTK